VSVPPVLITGASGYVGSHLAWHLAGRARPVRCLVRPQADPADVAFLRSCGAAVATGELCGGPSVAGAFEGVEAAVHLVGSIAPRRGESLKALHEEQTRALVSLCRERGVKKIVLLSALGTAPGAGTDYQATKWAAEAVLRGSSLNYVILRPSLIVGRLAGRRDSKLVARYRRLIESRKAVPVIAGGGNKIQPVFIADLLAAIAAVLDTPLYDRQELELGGPDIVSMRQLIEALMSALGSIKPIRAVPLPLARVAALMCQLVQAVPTVSWDQVSLATRDNVCSANRLAEVIGRTPAPVAGALATYKIKGERLTG